MPAEVAEVEVPSISSLISTKTNEAGSMDATSTAIDGSHNAKTMPITTAKSTLRASQRVRVLKEGGFATVNPFINLTDEMSVYEWFKVILFTVTLIAPLRFLLIILNWLMAWLFASISIAGLSPEEVYNNPITGWRRTVQQPVRLSSRIFLFLCGFYYVRTHGKPVLNAPIVICNHPSIFEPLWFGWVYFPIAVSKIDNLYIPIVGTVMKACNGIFVDRSSKESRKQCTERIKSVTTSHKWPPLLIFPEGTNTNGTSLISFKTGAFLPGEAIQPAVVRFKWAHFDPTGATSQPLGFFLYRALCQFSNHMEVTYLPIREPKEREKKDPNVFAKNLRAEMARALNVPMTEHSYEDVILQMAAAKNRLPSNSAVIEYNQVQQLFPGADLSLDRLRELLDQFSKMDVDRNGRLSYSDFLEATSLSDNKLTRRIWDFLDVYEDNSVDFREFITGMAIISNRVNNEQLLKFVWEAFDTTKTGSVTKETFETIIQKAMPDLASSQLEYIFHQMDKEDKGIVTFDEFLRFAAENPTYIQLALDFKGVNTSDQ